MVILFEWFIDAGVCGFFFIYYLIIKHFTISSGMAKIKSIIQIIKQNIYDDAKWRGTQKNHYHISLYIEETYLELLANCVWHLQHKSHDNKNLYSGCGVRQQQLASISREWKMKVFSWSSSVHCVSSMKKGRRSDWSSWLLSSATNHFFLMNISINKII